MIVPMNETHVPRIAALEKLCFSAPWSENSVRSELDNPWSLWLVEEQNGKVLGYAGSQMSPPEADVMNLAVAPEARRKGLGEKLMKALCTALAEKQMESLSLEVRASNEAAIALYTKLGFVQAGRRKEYYVNPREDALILRKELSLC